MSQQTEFINTIAPLIVKEARSRGYKVASAIIAQACLESNYGKSTLSAKYHNYFGMKCGSYWTGKSVNMTTKEEYKVGTLTTIKDNFRAYDNMEHGVKGYFDFIQATRYAGLKSCTTAESYLQTIKAAGYATSSAYVNNNMAVVNKFDLKEWDDFDNACNVTPVTKPKTEPEKPYKVGKVYTVKTDLRVRTIPYGTGVMFKDLTADAKLHARSLADGAAVLLKNTRVTCKDCVVMQGGAIWIKIPSGWICAFENGKDHKYIE